MKKGFTLIELLATIVILGILATITVPTMLNRINYFKDKAYEHMINAVENAAEEYVSENRTNLDELNTFGYINVKIDTLIKEGYLEGNLINPKTKVSIPYDDIVYVTIDYLHKVEVDYDVDQQNHPIITLKGPNIIKVKKNGIYTELGAIAMDKNGANISNQIILDGIVDTNTEDIYTISYSVPDSRVVKRYVIVTSDLPKDDIEIPVLSSNVLNNYIETTIGVAITNPIVTATDNVDGVVSPISYTSNTVNINATGTYHIKYDYTDSSGNKAETLDIKVVVKP